MKSADQKRPLKVFLCHAHADRNDVRTLYTRLTDDGVDAWLDKEKLLPGQDWELEIKKAVREADVVVVCLSKQFNQRGFRQKEVRLALDTAMEMPEGEIFIIPARLEECDNLESLRKWHWVDLFEDDGYEMLMRAFRIRADKIGATLQTRKSWLPKIKSSTPNAEKTYEIALDKEEKQAIAEKTSQEKSQKELEREAKKFVDIYNREKKRIRNEYKWKKFLSNVRYRLTLIRIYSVPLLFFVPAIALLVFFVFDLQKRFPFLIQEMQPTQTSVGSIPTTDVFTPTLSEITTPVATPLPTEITDAKGVSMVLVPEGQFFMGTDKVGTLYTVGVGLYDDASPRREVFLDSFYIDKYEVTNAIYKLCVENSLCEPPRYIYSYNRSFYYGNKQFDEYPVIFVDWYQANTFCNWRGGRLPTEAEWEKTARGTQGQKYPWGNNDLVVHPGPIVDCTKANFVGCGVGDTTKVGIYEEGKSPYGVYDLAGNVREWVADWYSDTYYQSLPDINPLGPDSGERRVTRGGSWDETSDDFLSAITRYFPHDPLSSRYNLGFRCAQDVSP